MPRRFPSPWTAERIPGGYVVKDATGQALAYVWADADIAKVLTMDEARRVVSNACLWGDPDEIPVLPRSWAMPQRGA